MDDVKLKEFLAESNRIEGITREVTDIELSAARQFIELAVLRVVDVEWIVNIFEPGAKLRDRPGMNVRVGGYVAPSGGPDIKAALEHILEIACGYHYFANSEFDKHRKYELLHPFTDCNGRSGRLLWLWMMKKNGRSAPLGFLHHWYYQSLKAGEVKPLDSREDLLERLREVPEYATEYLRAALEKGGFALMNALNDVYDAK